MLRCVALSFVVAGCVAQPITLNKDGDIADAPGVVGRSVEIEGKRYAPLRSPELLAIIVDRQIIPRDQNSAHLSVYVFGRTGAFSHMTGRDLLEAGTYTVAGDRFFVRTAEGAEARSVFFFRSDDDEFMMVAESSIWPGEFSWTRVTAKPR